MIDVRKACYHTVDRYTVQYKIITSLDGGLTLGERLSRVVARRRRLSPTNGKQSVNRKAKSSRADISLHLSNRTLNIGNHKTCAAVESLRVYIYFSYGIAERIQMGANLKFFPLHPKREKWNIWRVFVAENLTCKWLGCAKRVGWGGMFACWHNLCYMCHENYAQISTNLCELLSLCQQPWRFLPREREKNEYLITV